MDTINQEEIGCRQEIIDTSKLSEGTLVKNYKEMCSLLGCTTRTGNSKKSQIKNWKRYFDFEKVGQKFLIAEIYAEPFPTEDSRKLKEGLYVKYIELLLLKHLSECQGHQTKISKGSLYSVLGLANHNYKNLRDDYEIVRENVQENVGRAVAISNFDVRHFYQRADTKLTKILYTALESMSKRFLIKYESEYIIILNREEDDNGEEVLHTKIANAKEVSQILAAQHIVLNEMGFETITQVSLRYKLKEFYQRVNKYLLAEYQWQGVFSQLSIIYINNIAKEIPLKAEEIRKLSSTVQREQLNQIVINTLNNQAQKKFEKNDEDVTKQVIFGLDDNEKACTFKYKNDYIEAQEALADYLIDIKAPIYNKQSSLKQEIEKAFAELKEN